MERARKRFTEFLQFNVDGLQGRGFLKGLELAWRGSKTSGASMFGCNFFLSEQNLDSFTG